MRILLVNPPCDPKTIGLRFIAKVEPLGLELIGAGVKGLYDIRLVDLEVAPGDLEKTLNDFEPDVVGVTSEIVHRNTALAVLRRVRARYPRCLTVMGGHHPTMKPEDFSDPAVDLIVIGEGIDAFREICAIKSRGGSDYASVRGLAMPVAGGGVSKTPARPLPANMDDYPFPDRSLTERYRSKYFYLAEKSVAAVRTSFGCTHHCTFCSVRVYSQGCFIPRSAEKVFEEIRSLKEDFVIFCDDHSFVDPERMRKLAQLLLDAGVKKRYFVYARTDSIVKDRDVYALWAKAGLALVMSGLEAVDDGALKKSGKKTTLSTNEQAVKIAEELGFSFSAGFLVEPHFRREDFKKIDRYVRARPSILITEYTPLTPFPGTPLYRQLSSQLITQDPALFDLQHFVLPTALPTRELYKLLLQYNGKSIRRVIAYLLKHQPRVLASPHIVRALWGLLGNLRAYRTAHLHLPDVRIAAGASSAERQPTLERVEAPLA